MLFAYEVSFDQIINQGTICIIVTAQNQESYELMRKVFKKSDSITPKFPEPTELSVDFESGNLCSCREGYYIFLGVGTPDSGESIEFDASLKPFRKLIYAIRQDSREKGGFIGNMIRKCVIAYV